MLFPQDFDKYINEISQDSLLKLKPLEIMMINTDRGEIDDNLKEWKVTSFDSKSIKIKLEFEKPHEV